MLEKADANLVFDVRYKNRNVTFIPAGAMPLAGEMHMNLIATDKVPGKIGKIGGVLPGYQIWLDTKSNPARARVVDKLALPEYAEMMDQIRYLLATAEDFPQRIGENFRRDDCLNPVDVTLSKDPDGFPTNLATWLFHLKRLTDNGRLHLLKGELPSFKKIQELGIIYKGDNHGMSPINGVPQNLIYPVGKEPKQTTEQAVLQG